MYTFGENWPENAQTQHLGGKHIHIRVVFISMGLSRICFSLSLYTILEEETETASPAQKCCLHKLKILKIPLILLQVYKYSAHYKIKTFNSAYFIFLQSRKQLAVTPNGSRVHRENIKFRLLSIPIVFLLLRIWGTAQFFYSLSLNQDVQKCISHSMWNVFFVLGILQVCTILLCTITIDCTQYIEMCQ